MIQRYRGASSIWARKQQGGGDFLDVPTPKPEAKPAKKARTTKGTKVKDSSKSKSNAKIKDPNGEIQSDGDMFDDKRQALASLLEMLMEQADETGMLGSSSIGKGQKQLSSILSNENSGVEDPEILNGVIRVYCTHSQPNVRLFHIKSSLLKYSLLTLFFYKTFNTVWNALATSKARVFHQYWICYRW